MEFVSYKSLLNEKNPRVEITINDKKMVLELFEEVAPITVKNFLKLVDENFYDGIIMHRIIKNFMIQGGDPTGTGMSGSNEKIKGEFVANGVMNLLKHERGVISMARTNDPNSASSQFFICHKDALHLDGAYAAFGALVEGFEALDDIASVRTDYSDRPYEDQVIKGIRRI